MGLLHTQFASGAMFTAGSDYGTTGTSGINEFANRINVESGILGTVSGAYSATSGAYYATSGAFATFSASVSGTDLPIYGNFAGLSAGIGIDFNNGSVIAGELATDSNQGVANFYTNDFTVNAGQVSLKNKTSYLAIPASAFVSANPDTDDIAYASVSVTNSTSSDVSFTAPVNIPHGAVVTAVILYGSDTGDSWEMNRCNHTGGQNSMAAANVGISDSTINMDTIDNQNYIYVITSTITSSAAKIYGARITYTTDYI